MYYVVHKGNTEISRGISFSKMLDFTEFLKKKYLQLISL